MKNLTLIARADIKQALADTLRGLEQVSEFTFTHIESHSVQDEYDKTLSARDRVVGYTPHIRVDILLQDADVDAVLQSLRSANCGLAGRGSYQVTMVEKQGGL
jgi:nitrogen regulatory protein P-II 1